MDLIENKVSNSVLEVFDLEDYFPRQNLTGIDLSQWLFEGFILKEKDFREALKNHDWAQYQDHLVYIFCSTDAILPSWAKILVCSYLDSIAAMISIDTKEKLIENYYQKILATIDYSVYVDKPLILKGCSKKAVPELAYLMAIKELQKVSKSIMYGEACSAVPIFKKKK